MVYDIIDCKESLLSDWLILNGWVSTVEEIEQERNGG
jgi:hypothetical protein